MIPDNGPNDRADASPATADPMKNRQAGRVQMQTGRIRKRLWQEGQDMPWARTMTVRLEHGAGDQRLILHLKTPLAMLLTAGTVMKRINRIVARSVPTIKRVMMKTEPVKHGRKIYRPVIKWQVNPADRRAKRMRKSISDGLLSHVWSDQFALGVLGKPDLEQLQLMQKAFADGGMQEQAIYRMVCHLAKNGLISSKNGVFDLGWLHDAGRQEQARNSYIGFMTRRQALTIMDELGLLKLPTGRQRHAYWPRMESLASLPGDQALALLSRVVGQDMETLKGPSRKAEVAYCRHLIMYVLYMTSNRTLMQTAEVLGRTDHTTTRNAIRKIREYSQRWEGHADLINLLCDIVDNLGVYMVKHRKLNVDENFTITRTAGGAILLTIDNPEKVPRPKPG